MPIPPPQGGLGQSWFVLDFEAAYAGDAPPAGGRGSRQHLRPQPFSGVYWPRSARVSTGAGAASAGGTPVGSKVTPSSTAGSATGTWTTARVVLTGPLRAAQALAVGTPASCVVTSTSSYAQVGLAGAVCLPVCRSTPSSGVVTAGGAITSTKVANGPSRRDREDEEALLILGLLDPNHQEERRRH